MVNAPKKNLLPLPPGKYGTLTKQSTRRHHKTNKGISPFEAERVRALGALPSLQSKKKLPAEKRLETHYLSHEEKEKWIKDYVDRETAGARNRIEDGETAIIEEQEYVSNAEKEQSTTRKPEKSFHEMLNAIRDSLSNLASSQDEVDGADEVDEEDTERGKLTEDDEPCCVMGTSSKTVQHRMESSGQKQMRVDKPTQPGWGDAADFFRERDMKYGLAELIVPAVVKPQTNKTAAISLPTTFGESMQTLDIVRGQSQMPQGTSRPRSSQMRLGSERLQSHTDIAFFLPDTVAHSSPIEIAKAVEPITFHPHILRP